MDLKLDKSYYY